ncbi:MAG: hypothetical protein E7262_06250 [Lachnospiraceae bacterium]|nr:hypothetical protein [Lachnospiraceae bacterium]
MKRKLRIILPLVVFILASVWIGCSDGNVAYATTVKADKEKASDDKEEKEEITVAKPAKLVQKALGYKSVKLQWLKVKGVTGYVVYRYDGSTKKYNKVCLTTKQTTATVKNLVQGGAYAFAVKAYKTVDKKKYYSKYTNTVKIVTVPNSVKKITVSNVQDKTVKLSWSKPSGANLYYVYSYNVKKNKYTRLLSTTSTSTTITGLVPGETYIFVVKSCAQTKDGAYKTNGALSPKTYVYTAPSVAKSLVQSGLTDTSITIKWNKASGADGYKVYKYDAKNNKGTLLKKVSASTTTYTHKSLKSGTEYCYAVRSYAKTAGKEINATSFEYRYAITRPAKVKGLKVTDETVDSMKLSWSKVSGADGYCIYKYNTKTEKYDKIKTTTSTSYKVTGLSGFTSYKYIVKAYKEYRYNTGQYTGDGVSVSARTDLGTPAQVRVTGNTDNSISYEWDKVHNATGYYITVVDGAGNELDSAKVDKNTTTYTYTSETPGVINATITVTPFATVISVNQVDNKEYLGGKASLTACNMLGKVEGLEQFSCELDSVGIAWKKIDFAQRYEVYRLNSSDKYTKIGETKECEYIISGLKPGTACDVKIRAVAEVDGQVLRGDFSSNLEAVSTYNAPTLSIGEACQKYIKLTWDKVSSADGYKLYKYNATTKEYDLLKTINGASTTSYTDTAVSSGKSFTYRIVVFKDIDGLINESELGTPTVAKIGVYGVDVSQYQNTIDWAKVKAAGVDYAIIRATRYSSSGNNGTNLIKDNMFDTNMKNAIAAGIKVGVYVYSYADSVAEARKEAEYVISLVKNYKMTYPIYFDIEDPARKSTSYKAENTNMSIAFCEKVKEAGYKPGVYSGASFFVSYLNVSQLSSYDIWVARYLYSDTSFSFPGGMTAINNCISKGYTYGNKYTSIKADMWQYTSSGVVAGIPGRVDMNYGYKSY